MTWSISGCHNKRVWLHLFSWLDCSWQNVLIPYGLPLYLLAAGNVRLFLLLLVSRCDKRFPCDILNSPSARNVMDYFLKLCCHSALLYDNIKLPYIALSFKKHFQKNTKLSNFPTHIPDHVPGNDRAAFSCDASLRENAWNKRTAEWLVTVFFFNLLYFQTGGGGWQMEDCRAQIKQFGPNTVGGRDSAGRFSWKGCDQEANCCICHL